MRLLKLVLATALLGGASLLPSAAADGGASALTPTSLRCSDEVNPLGVDVPRPRLSWQLKSDINGARQTAYRVIVSSSAGMLAANTGDLWDSGRAAAADSLHHPYAGVALKSSQQVFWKVRVWDQDGQVSEWSEPATWTMGLLAATDWQAKWIGEKSAPPAPKRAGVGYHAAEARSADDVKWVQIDLGASQPISAVRLHAMRHAGKDGFGFPVRFKIEVSEDPSFTQTRLVADQTGADFANPGFKAVAFPARGESGRYVRVTATKLWKRDAMFCFALRQIEVESGGRNVAVKAEVSHRDSVETWGWASAALADGLGLITAASLVDTPPESPSLRLRREFTVKPGLRRAVVHVCGLGQYELSANGRKVSEDLFTPGWTKYDKTCLYDTRDLTSMLRSGPNALGLELAGGMYRVTGGRYTKFTGSFGPLKAIAHLRLEYADGTSEILVTDDQWRVASGPITFSCIFGGEDYDARRDLAGWNHAGFSATNWMAASVLDGPGGTLRGQSASAPPLRAFESIKPISVKELRSGVFVYDLGQNAPIIPRVRLKGSPGAVVRITPAELLAPSGAVDRGSAGGGQAYWQYTSADDAAATWFPKFWYHGSRYLEVQLLAGANGQRPVIESLEGVVVHSSSPAVGEFACSNDLFNRIHTLIRWAQRANLVSVITDCPHRERLGWLEQYHLNGPSLRYEWDLTRVFAKGMQDMADSQLASGLVPDIAPEYVVFSGGFRDSPEWGSAFVIVPWQQYEWTGDAELLRRYYDGMKRYVAYLGSKSKNHIVSHGLGDWYDIGPKPPGPAQLTPMALTATAFYYYDAWIVAQTARVLGKTADETNYTALAGEIAAAFNREFFKTNPPRYATDSQCANSIPLVMNLVAPDHRNAVVDAIAADVARRGNAITAGDVGYRYLLRALADGGRSDIIFAMNNQSEHPGYGYQLKKGATALTEAWDAGRGSSQNHFMLGQINEWFYHDLAGLAPDPAGPGFARVIVRPQPVGEITWARASYESPRGKIATSWKRDGRRFALEVSVPPGSTALVHVPGARPRATDGAALARPLSAVNGATVFAVPSGRYSFEAELGDAASSR